jgi:hypothetical protein
VQGAAAGRPAVGDQDKPGRQGNGGSLVRRRRHRLR